MEIGSFSYFSTLFQSVPCCDRKRWIYHSILLAVLVILYPALVQGAEIFTGTLAFDTESLDLDSGAVIDAALPGEGGGISVSPITRCVRQVP